MPNRDDGGPGADPRVPGCAGIRGSHHSRTVRRRRRAAAAHCGHMESTAIGCLWLRGSAVADRRHSRRHERNFRGGAQWRTLRPRARRHGRDRGHPRRCRGPARRPGPLVAAVDVDWDRLLAFGQRHGVPRLYRDLDAMLAAEQPDLVHLCTPPGLHAEQAVGCLRRGVPVLCEKPPALSLAELDEIAAAGDRDRRAVRDRVPAPLRQRRARPAPACATGGALGPPLTAVCHTLWFRPDEYFAVPWRGRWDIEGGGPDDGARHPPDGPDARRPRPVARGGGRRRPPGPARPTPRTCRARSSPSTTARWPRSSTACSRPRETSYLRFDFAEATVELTHLYGYGDADWRVTGAPGPEDAVAALWAAQPTGTASGHGAQFAARARRARGRGAAAGDASRTPGRRWSWSRRSTPPPSPVGRCGGARSGPGSPFYDRMDGTGAPWAATGRGRPGRRAA